MARERNSIRKSNAYRNTHFVLSYPAGIVVLLSLVSLILWYLILDSCVS
jgi:hypothetical protein